MRESWSADYKAIETLTLRASRCAFEAGAGEPVMSKATILIIKHGFSETCDHSVSPIVSYGDVFRCTCLLELYKGYHVSWITAYAARDLLTENHLIDRLILADSPEDLGADTILDHYDTVINLEKQKDWCEFAAGLSVNKRYGFKDWTSSGDECFYPESARALSAGLGLDGYWPMQQTLFQTAGREWTGQRYVLGYQPKVMPIYDIGLNYHIGPKWPTKAWAKSNWQELYERLSDNYTVCWQQSLNSIRHYIDWIVSCRLLVTCDSLGLHLALGLNRKVVALFGPTASEPVYMYGNGVKVTPACERKCMPCYRSSCAYEQSCMEFISVSMIAETIEAIMPPAPRRERIVSKLPTLTEPVLTT